MIRIALASTGAAALLAGIGLASAPAAAQDAGDSVAEIIVYGNDPCPRSTDDEVVVCARRPEAERYRIPERLREGGSLQSRTAWAQRARSIEYVGRSGPQSCSPVGPAGHTGCLEQMIEAARSERAAENEANTAPVE